MALLALKKRFSENLPFSPEFSLFLRVRWMRMICGAKATVLHFSGRNWKRPKTQKSREISDFTAFFDGGPGGIRTLDLSDANRTLSRTRHNASTEHLEGNGCVLFKTGTGCVLFDIFHRTVRTSAPILNKQELSITPSLRQPSEKYSANRWKSLGTSVNTTHSDERSERQGTR